MAFMDQWLADIRRVKDITDALSKEFGSENIINIKRVLRIILFGAQRRKENAFEYIARIYGA